MVMGICLFGRRKRPLLFILLLVVVLVQNGDVCFINNGGTNPTVDWIMDKDSATNRNVVVVIHDDTRSDLCHL